MITLVRGELEGDYDIRRVEVVGPTVSGELAQAGTIAVIASLLAILVLYLVPVRVAVRAGRHSSQRCTTWC